LPFDCKKIAKNPIFKKKKPKIVIFFNKIAKNFLFFSKMTIFGKFFEKKKSSFWQFFDIQMAIFQGVSHKYKGFTSQVYVLKLHLYTSFDHSPFGLVNINEESIPTQ